MVYRGRVKDGVIVLDDSVSLPDGTEVQVETVATPQPTTLAERFADVIGTAKELPDDMAKNHDHYLHGAPRR